MVNVNYCDISNDEIDEEFNQLISATEILQADMCLKSNKSLGVDDIVNELIKSTIS